VEKPRERRLRNFAATVIIDAYKAERLVIKSAFTTLV